MERGYGGLWPHGTRALRGSTSGRRLECALAVHLRGPAQRLSMLRTRHAAHTARCTHGTLRTAHGTHFALRTGVSSSGWIYLNGYLDREAWPRRRLNPL